ncbi:hypothetical protein BV25DRAFT_1993968 [Artomyces pyxidatus]|uniref:Uncharacterized protein n=1 Tax=Artomyces pyxidatus TaxID=48021 RepID=A0ACB8SQS3_9AGAM|nr:hypothetical protein BV25DRAFT_1993968 [Artomyces pyxidatus]
MSKPNVSEVVALARQTAETAKEEGKLDELTHRLVRKTVEEALSLEPGTLEDDEYKRAMKDAVMGIIQRDGSEDAGTEEAQAVQNKRKRKSDDTPSKETSSPTKVTKERLPGRPRPSLKKQFKSAEFVTDSDTDEEPEASSSKSKKVESDVEMDNVSPKKKAKRAPKAAPSAKPRAKPASRKSETGASSTARGRTKSKYKSAELVDSDSDALSDAKVPSGSKADTAGQSKGAAKEDQDSEPEAPMVEEPPKKKGRTKAKAAEKPAKPKAEPKAKRGKKAAQELSKDEETIKRLKSIVVACGVRKIWTKEFQGLDTPTQQIARLRAILADLGMNGRLSMEKAREIKAERELAKELEDVQKFGEAVAAGKPFRSSRSGKAAAERDESDGKGAGEEEPESDIADVSVRPKNNARRSIMAFLGEQSDDD